MGEVKRRKPWEEVPKEESGNVGTVFLNQLLICGIIGIGALFVFNTNDSAKWKGIFQQEISKNLKLEDFKQLVDKSNQLIRDYTLKEN